MCTIKEAVLAAMDDWKRDGQLNVDRMRDQIEWLVDEAINEWRDNNDDAVTDDGSEAC